MFHGSIVALVTPMDEEGQIDFAAVERLVDFHVGAGTGAIVVAGTTGESATLSDDEYARLLMAVVGRTASRVPVLAGTGGADTARAVKRTLLAGELGADAALVVTPYYNRPMQSGLLAHFNTLADSTRIPLVLYNVPTRTAVDMLPATVAQLAPRDEIVGIKEAVPDRKRIAELVALCGDKLTVFSGDDPTCLEAMRSGAGGVISVAANVVPRQMAELCGAAQEGNWPEALEIDAGLRHLYGLLALETNPIPVKWALFDMNLCGRGIRLPLLPLDEKHRRAMEIGLQQLGLIACRT